MRIIDWSSDVCSSYLRCFDKLSTNGRKGGADLRRDPLTRQPLPRRPRFASPPDRPVERAEREGFAQHVMVAKGGVLARVAGIAGHEQHRQDRKSTRLNSSH